MADETPSVCKDKNSRVRLQLKMEIFSPSGKTEANVMSSMEESDAFASMTEQK